MAIFVMHGVVRGATKRSLVCRNMVDESAFVEHLRRREPYVGIEEAQSGGGDALTIDDATEAGARAAELVREHGSKVVFFVNSHNISHGTPYFFSILNVALEVASDKAFEFSGRVYDLSSLQGKLQARLALKHRILAENREEIRCQVTRNLASRIAPGQNIEIPPHLSTISLTRLQHLAELGITIGNHGRTHAEFANLDEAACATEIETCASWLQDVVGSYPNYFAVPFGERIPPWRNSKLYTLYMLATDVVYPGALGPQVVNRPTLRILATS